MKQKNQDDLNKILQTFFDGPPQYSGTVESLEREG
jgi:hypothetical protein